MTKKDKVEKVMGEWKAGTLTSHGKKVTNYDQAIAIALSEAGLSKKMKEGGGIGFVPMDLEEELMITAKWGGTNIKGVIGILNAMIDSKLTDDDLKVKPIKNTRFQIERATEKKIQEIWNKIEPNYKGDFKGNMYYSTIKRLVNRSGTDDNILKRYKPFRKYQYAEGGGIEKENALMVANNNKQIEHHTKEMEEALKDTDYVPAWVVAKVNRSASDLSDATHYLEGQEDKYEKGGDMNKYSKGGGIGNEQLNLVFSRQDDFKKAKYFYENESSFYPSDINDEFRTFVFDIENGEADVTEHYLGQELQETDLDGYYFEVSDKMAEGGGMGRYAKGGSIDTPKIYVADLEAYNNGKLVGEWLDLSDFEDGEEVSKEISKLLKKWGAEEYAIHDVENVPSSMYSEYMGEEDFDKIIKIYKASEENDLPYEVISEIMLQYEPEDLEEWISDYYEGHFDNDTDLAYNVVESIGSVSELGERTIDMYFDYEKFGRDLAINDYTEIEDGYYFRTPRYAKGGLTNERRYVNKSQDYEVRYAKNRLKRTGYKNERKFAVGGEIGNTVIFSRYGERTTGRVTDKLKNGYEVVTDEGTILVEPQEVISFSETPIAKKKRFGFFEGGGSIESKKQAILEFVNSFTDKPKNWSEATDELPELHHDIADEYNGKYDFDFNKRSSLSEKNLRHKKGIKFLLNKLSDEKINYIYSKWEEILEDKFEGGGEIENKIEKLKKVVSSKMLPESVKAKAQAEIDKLEKELHESKETKAEEKEEHKFFNKKSYSDENWNKIKSFLSEKYTNDSVDEILDSKIMRFTEPKTYNGFIKFFKDYPESFEEFETKADEKAEHKAGGSESKEDLIKIAKKMATERGLRPTNVIDELDAITTISSIMANESGFRYAKVDDLGNNEYTIEISPSTEENNMAGMVLNKYKDGTYEVAEMQAGKDGNFIKVFGEYKNLKPAVAKLLKGNKQKPMKVIDMRSPSQIKAEENKMTGESEGERKAGMDKIKAVRKPTTRKAPVKKAVVKKTVVKKAEVKKEVETPAKPKADHKKLVAKLKAKKGATPSNEPSKGHKRNESSDRKRSALPLGKRISEDGNVYYENRLNRGDLSKEDKFEKGGEVKGSDWNLNLNW